MTKTYNVLVGLKDANEIDELIQDCMKKADSEHSENIKKYKLWEEYLKRSEKFREVCEWFEQAKQRHPYHLETNKFKYVPKSLKDYSVFASTYDQLKSSNPLLPLKSLVPMLGALRNGAEIFRDMFSETFFSWAIAAELPERYEPELLMNLFVFGNVHKEPPEAQMLRFIHLIESCGKPSVFKLHEIVDTIFKHVESDQSFLDRREPSSLNDFKHHFKRFLETDMFLTLCIFNPYKNKDQVKEMVGKLIDERRTMGTDPQAAEDDFFGFFEPDQFECLQGNIRVDELERYLKTYDLKQGGKTNREIAAIAYPNDEPKDKDTIRKVMRDRQKAETVIENVEKGFFPGSY
jgi:hypothetical protein